MTVWQEFLNFKLLYGDGYFCVLCGTIDAISGNNILGEIMFLLAQISFKLTKVKTDRRFDLAGSVINAFSIRALKLVKLQWLLMHFDFLSLPARPCPAKAIF